MGKHGTRGHAAHSETGDGFTAKDRQNMEKILSYVVKLKDKLSVLHKSMKRANNIIKEQNAEINALRSHLNVTNYRTDNLEQYGRREAFRIHKVTDALGTDPVKIVLDAAKEIEKRCPPAADGSRLTIDVKPSDIHRCHFIGSNARKKLICKFTPAAYHIRNKFIMNKKYLNKITEGKFSNAFLTEDLTPLRSRLVWYIKNKFDHKYHKVHTRNGVIKMKEKNDLTNDGDWISISNPDDLHKLIGNEMDIDLLNEGLKSFKILPYFPVVVNEVLDLDSEIDDDDFANFD